MVQSFERQRVHGFVRFEVFGQEFISCQKKTLKLYKSMRSIGVDGTSDGTEITHNDPHSHS